MTTQIFYPHFLNLSSSHNVVRFDSVDFDPQYQMISRHGGADAFPCFVGASSSDPQISFSTPSVWDVLAACTDHNVLADLSAGDVTLYYRAGKPKAFRKPLADAVHQAVVLKQSALLSWSSITAREDQDASISAMLKTARKDQATDPWQTQGDVNNLPRSLCEDIFTLGPIVSDGRVLTSVHEVDWQNNLRPYSRKTSFSPRDPDWQSFHGMAPVITLTTNDLDELEQNVVPRDKYGGKKYSELRIYLRKRQREGMYVPDTTAGHIELVAFGGWKAGTRITGREPAEGQVEFHLAAAVIGSIVQGTDFLFGRSLSKIPSISIAPALADYTTTVVDNGDMVFITPNLDGGGIPTAYSLQSGALPGGVTIDATSGLVSGIIDAESGSYNFTMRASNGLGNSDKPIQIDVN